jgi:glycosyltransferase involved in cell wall biosynthesis
LTHHARKTIEVYSRGFQESAVINHGINQSFFDVKPKLNKNNKEAFKVVYISNAAMYKHQWHVVEALNMLVNSGLNVELLLVGGGQGKAQELLECSLNKFDPERRFVSQLPFVNNNEIPKILSESDLFLFASSCENMPITLMEGMASGLPIVCSQRGPMPEVLQDGGVYFDPENSKSIRDAIFTVFNDKQLKSQIRMISRERASNFTWEKCAHETWSLISQIAYKNR